LCFYFFYAKRLEDHFHFKFCFKPGKDSYISPLIAKREVYFVNFRRKGEEMNNRKLILFSMAVLFMAFLSGDAWANKAETKIAVPENAAQGSEITIRVTVIHSANNFFHHVEWLWIKVNDTEIARWDYTAIHRPEGATFTKEIKFKVEGDAEIKAKASCNIHGSAGEAVGRVSAKE
jgi:desulfoferrodoxin (superoxide reductase-like protein)